MDPNRRDCVRLAGTAIAVLLVGPRRLRARAADVGRALDSALAGEHRSAANKARDRYRHEKQTLQFVKPD
jgi:predicted methyltransferase